MIVAHNPIISLADDTPMFGSPFRMPGETMRHDSAAAPRPNSRSKLRRRDVLRGAAAGVVGSLLTGLPKGYAGGLFADDTPEQPDVRLGFVAIQSCGPIVIGHEKGFFKKHGLNTTLAKENGWGAVRDKVVSGENHGSHLKYAQPLGQTVGVLGGAKTTIVAPYTLCRGGSVFMASIKLKDRLTIDPKTWKTVADELRANGEAMTVALPLPFGWHGMMYRHWLANAGINADKDLKVITLPPAQMVQNIRVGTMHACAMVEPWGDRGVTDKITFIVAYGHELWPDHPIKAFGMLETFANEKPKTVKAMLCGLQEAAQWCDDPNNHEELAKILSTPTYLNSPAPTILRPLRGEFAWGDGRTAKDPRNAISYSRDTSPQPREAKWHLAQFRRWGHVTGTPDYEGVTKTVLRKDLYLEAMAQLGVTPPAENNDPITLWDKSAFDPAKPEESIRSFAVHSMKD
jgi:nitrate/nitrite transport system substrate-binding protein